MSLNNERICTYGMPWTENLTIGHPEALIVITLPDRVADALPPAGTPLHLIDADGSAGDADGILVMPYDEVLRELLRQMIVGRRFDAQATALTKQGHLAVYPSSRGQEACQVGAVLAMREQDWLFPTYRGSVAIMTRGVDPLATLTLLRADWHCGYAPYRHRVAPQCTPLPTSSLHAVGLGHAARVKGEDTVAVAF